METKGLKCATVMVSDVSNPFSFLEKNVNKHCVHCVHGSKTKCRCFIQCQDIGRAVMGFLAAGCGPIRLPAGAASSYGIAPKIAGNAFEWQPNRQSEMESTG